MDASVRYFTRKQPKGVDVLSVFFLFVELSEKTSLFCPNLTGITKVRSKIIAIRSVTYVNLHLPPPRCGGIDAKNNRNHHFRSMR